MTKFHPTGGLVFVVPEQRTRRGRLHLHPSYTPTAGAGRVMAAASHWTDPQGRQRPVECHPGDRVLFDHRDVGHCRELDLGGQRVVAFHYRHIQAVLSPKEIELCP